LAYSEKWYKSLILNNKIIKIRRSFLTSNLPKLNRPGEDRSKGCPLIKLCTTLRVNVDIIEAKN
jgi:hypothetical protein